MESYILHIAGITIKILFPLTKDRFFRSLFIRQWKPMLVPYFSSNKNEGERTIRFFETSFPDFDVHNDIISIPMARRKGKTFFTPYYISLRQFYWILSQIVLEEIAKKCGFFLHCSAVHTAKGVMLFLGPSGSGKSTIARMLYPNYPTLTDDQAIIRKDKKGYSFYQMFVPEKNEAIKISTKKYNIHKFFFLKKSKFISQKPLTSKSEVLERMVSQLTTNTDISPQTTANLIEFVKLTNNYNLLSFNLNKPQIKRFFQQIV